MEDFDEDATAPEHLKGMLTAEMFLGEPVLVGVKYLDELYPQN